jgi:hypothetical protein
MRVLNAASSSDCCVLILDAVSCSARVDGGVVPVDGRFNLGLLEQVAFLDDQAQLVIQNLVLLRQTLLLQLALLREQVARADGAALPFLREEFGAQLGAGGELLRQRLILRHHLRKVLLEFDDLLDGFVGLALRFVGHRLRRFIRSDLQVLDVLRRRVPNFLDALVGLFSMARDVLVRLGPDVSGFAEVAVRGRHGGSSNLRDCMSERIEHVSCGESERADHLDHGRKNLALIAEIACLVRCILECADDRMESRQQLVCHDANLLLNLELQVQIFLGDCLGAQHLLISSGGNQLFRLSHLVRERAQLRIAAAKNLIGGNGSIVLIGDSLHRAQDRFHCCGRVVRRFRIDPERL